MHRFAIAYRLHATSNTYYSEYLAPDVAAAKRMAEDEGLFQWGRTFAFAFKL